MKISQIVEYNRRNIFLEKSSTKCGGKTSPRLFRKIKTEHIQSNMGGGDESPTLLIFSKKLININIEALSIETLFFAVSVSNAKLERIFSKFEHVKTNFSCPLGVKHLKNILRII